MEFFIREGFVLSLEQFLLVTFKGFGIKRFYNSASVSVAVLWCIWLEHNLHIFKDTTISLELLRDEVVFWLFIGAFPMVFQGSLSIRYIGGLENPSASSSLFLLHSFFIAF